MGRGSCQPTLGRLLMVGGLAQGGHQHRQEAGLQQQGIPVGRRKSTEGPSPSRPFPSAGPPREEDIPGAPPPPAAPPPEVTHHWK